jgi:LPS export ABC transporter permease LptG
VAWRYLRGSRNAISLAIALGACTILLCQAFGYHEKYLPWMPGSGLELPKGFDGPPILGHFFYYISPYLSLIALVGSLVWAASLARVWPSIERTALSTAVYGSCLALWRITEDLHDKWTLDSLSTMGEPASWTFYIVKLLLLAFILVSPAGMLWWYGKLGTLDRYVLRNFFQPLMFCLAAFASLMIIMDLLGNLKDFQEAHTPISAILGFYFDFIPYIYVTVLSAALLLSVLFALTKMSRANEIVAMLTAGRSLGEVLSPIIMVAAYATVISVAVNYHWAPRGEGQREAVMRAMTDKRKGAAAMLGVMHHNEETRRTWFIGSVPYELRGEKMVNIEVRQMDGKGRLQKGWYARTARWWPGAKMWSFYNGMEVSYRNGVATGDIILYADKASEQGERMDVNGWPETPWSIISGSLLPDVLSVPELNSYLRANNERTDVKLAPFRTQLWQRFALPLQGLVMVLIAAPLGVAFSRRGSLGGIAGAVIMFFMLIFINELFVGLGKSSHLPAGLTVWFPHLIFGSIGSLLLYSKSQNKELPKLSWRSLVAWWGGAR